MLRKTPTPTPRLTRATLRFVALTTVASIALAACSAAGGPTSGATPSASESPSPAASVTGSSGASAGPDVDALAALDAFRAFIQTDQTFHMTADMQLTISGEKIDMDVAEDVSGGNEKGRIDIRGAGVSIHMEVVVADGKAYLKLANRTWEKVDVDTSSSNPLGDLRVDGLQPIDTVNVGGVPAHHFRVDDPAAIDPDTITGNALTALTLKSASFDVYVNDDGVPLTAKLAFSGTGTFQGKSAPVEAKIRYDFSRFGVPVEIVAPI